MGDRLPRMKPLLRGVSHLVAFFVACAAGIVLVASAPSGRASIAADSNVVFVRRWKRYWRHPSSFFASRNRLVAFRPHYAGDTHGHKPDEDP